MRATAILLVAMGAGACSKAAPDAPPPVDELMTSISACAPEAATHPATGRAGTLRLLRAWLDGAELGLHITEPRPKVDDALRARGAALYTAHCATCHGDKADGKGPTAKQLADAPRDLAAGVYELRSTPAGSLPTDEDLFHVISHGVHGTGMPPWMMLSESDRWALVAHLKARSPAFADDEAPPPVELGTPPPVTPALLAQGDHLFHTAGCSTCHGDDAKGHGPAAPALHMSNGDPALPRDLTSVHFHRGSDITDIYQSLTTGLDGSPMASFARVMTAPDMWAVAAYVHNLVPPYVAGPDGLRCLAQASGVPDELVGVRTELAGFPP
jgi:mono/diheme cytochrome c family protein